MQTHLALLLLIPGMSSGYLLVIMVVVIIVLLATSSQKDGPICPHCRWKNRIGARYCGQCGQPLAGQSH